MKASIRAARPTRFTFIVEFNFSFIEKIQSAQTACAETLSLEIPDGFGELADCTDHHLATLSSCFQVNPIASLVGCNPYSTLALLPLPNRIIELASEIFRAALIGYSTLKRPRGGRGPPGPTISCAYTVPSSALSLESIESSSYESSSKRALEVNPALP